MPESRPFLSVVVPVLNEEGCIAAFIARMTETLQRLVPSWEIVVVDDGSRDRTRDIVEAHAAADPRVRLLAGAHRGKGAALQRGMREACGEWRFMADADLAMPPENLSRFLDVAHAANPPAIIIGSREAPGSQRIGESRSRHAIGRVFNWIVRLLAVPGLKDTQCGFKLFSADAAQAVFPRLTVSGFAFDVELLFLARRAGLDIREVGILWHGRGDSRVALGRGAAAFLDIARIRWRWRHAPVNARAAWVIPALTVAVFAIGFLYRYNALGGALGGFDGDHFMYYLGARQAVHGEHPMRDFADAGLQGAWPALTYELSALAMRLGGETLLPEALYTVGAVALAAALLFRTAAAVTGPIPALIAAVLTILASTKLYAYHKVLVFAVAVTLLLRYARRPAASTAALLAAWSAVAFLFRHDYLVYLAPPVGVLIVARQIRARGDMLRHLLVYGAVTTVLLLGPLYSIARYVGVGEYLRANLALTANESRRTDLEWPEFHAAGDGVSAFFADEQNAAAWLYYLCLAIPPVAAVVLIRKPIVPGLDVAAARAFLLSLVLLAALLDKFLLRGNLPGRLGDLGAPIAVLAAWLATGARGARLPIRLVASSAVGLLLIVTTMSVSTVGNAWQELDTTGFRDSLQKIGRRLGVVTAELRALPPLPAGPAVFGDANVVDYLRACTRPSDRVLVVADSPEVAALAARPFAAGQPTFRPGFYTRDEDQALMLQRLTRQAVPVVLTEVEEYEENFVPGFPQIAAHIATFYEPVGELPAVTGGPMRVWARRDRVPAGRYDATGLPCFR